jgi:type II secretory pathway predicted ATPase ExeA
MWLRHWNLSYDPFAGANAVFVPTRPHTEAVARLVYGINAGERLVSMFAGPGFGKTQVLRRALAELRAPARKIVCLSGAAAGTSVARALAERLGVRVAGTADSAAAWRALHEAILLCHWIGKSLVVAIDDVQLLNEPASQAELACLSHGGPFPEGRLTLLVSGRPVRGGFSWDPGGSLKIRLMPLTRTEAVGYVEAKLAAAGRTQSAFVPAALAALHALSEGVPRFLDRLGSLALISAADQGADLVSEAIVEELVIQSAEIAV